MQRAYSHMNAGDPAAGKKDGGAEPREYGAAERLVPDSLEAIYRHAAALVNMNRADEALPLVRRVFVADPNWRTALTPRLAKPGLVPGDAKLIERVVAVGR